MAKPRTFISSTAYDLKDARAGIQEFLEGLGHEPLMHEMPSFGVAPGKHSHVACLDQVDNADYLVLIIGGRRGGTYVGSERSITNEEYRRALKRKIPVMVFVKKDVDTAAQLYKKNPKANFSPIVDDARIFDFLDVVKSQSEDNWVRTFDTVNDIVDGLRGQFAYIHLAFSQRHVKDWLTPSKAPKGDERHLVPFPSDFSALTDGLDNEIASSIIDGLRALHGVLRKMNDSKAAGYEEKAKTLWVLGRYGKRPSDDLVMPESSFKQYAWGQSKGTRVFEQLGDFGAHGRYEVNDDGINGPRLDVELSFNDDGQTTYALRFYVADLIKKYGDDDGLHFFMNADMRLYGEGTDPDSLASRKMIEDEAKAAAARRPKRRR